MKVETSGDLKWENIKHSYEAQSDNCIIEGNRNYDVFFIIFQ